MMIIYKELLSLTALASPFPQSCLKESCKSAW